MVNENLQRLISTLWVIGVFAYRERQVIRESRERVCVERKIIHQLCHLEIITSCENHHMFEILISTQFISFSSSFFSFSSFFWYARNVEIYHDDPLESKWVEWFGKKRANRRPTQQSGQVQRHDTLHAQRFRVSIKIVMRRSEICDF